MYINEKNLKKYFKNTFGELDPQENIAIVLVHKTDKKNCLQHFIRTENEFIYFVRQYRENYNIYCSIACTNGVARKDENILSSRVIALDFDKKDIPEKSSEELSKRIMSQLKLFIFQMVESGHGYHIYIPIEKTTDINRWNTITKKLCNIWGADIKATLKTQIMRVPESLNWKEEIPPKVKLKFSNGNFQPIPLYKIEKAIRNYERKKEKQKQLEYLKAEKSCIFKMLNGVQKGLRNFAMGRIISYYRYKGISKEKIKNIIKEWNQKNIPPKYEKELDSEFEFYWRKEYNLNGCYPTNKTDAKKLETFCCADCKYKKANLLRFTKSKTYIELPIKFFSPIMLSNFSGNELITLLCLFQQQSATVNVLCKLLGISRKSMLKYIKHLKNTAYIKTDGTIIHISKKYQNYEKTIKIREDLILHYRNKNIAGNDVKIYLAVVWNNNHCYYSTQKDISEFLGINRSHVSTSIKKLNSVSLIFDDFKINGASTISQLKAA